MEDYRVGSSSCVETLPDDFMLHVFSFLDAISLCKVRRVCKSWKDLSSDEILWKHKLMSDIKTWKQISSTSIPESYLEQESDIHPQEAYIKSCPDIQKWKRNFYERTTLHQLTNFLRSFMPTKKFTFGVGASAMDSMGKGQSFFSKLLSFDAANVFQHCGEFPGRFRGHGGGFQFKYKRHMLELCLMYVAARKLREVMSEEQTIAQLEEKMNDEGYLQLLHSLDGYVHTIDARIKENSNEGDTLNSLNVQSKEMQLLDKHLKPGVPVLILSMRKVESDPFISTYQVSESLHLKSLNRPWMVSECSAQMVYRDIVDPMDWLISVSKPGT